MRNKNSERLVNLKLKLINFSPFLIAGIESQRQFFGTRVCELLG